jgi:NADPH:quinone reductase-like Zn-dependent oxidoreductase
MRAVQFEEYGPAEVLHLVDVETPAAGPGQVQLRVAAAGVNPADFKWRAGLFQTMMPLTFPHVLGYDAAGTVTAVGPGVTRFKTGDRVVATVKSGYAEYAVTDEALCALLPEALDFAQGAALPCAALTGVQLVEQGICPEKGQTVLVTGATGSVGRFSVQAALALGAHVVAAVRPSYFDEARQLGANEVISIEDGDREGLAFDHVADTVGGPAVAKLCRHVAPGGVIATVATTPIDPEGLPTAPKFFGYNPNGARLARIVDDVASGVIPMPVARRLPLAEAAEAHRLMEAGGLRGKVILEP